VTELSSSNWRDFYFFLTLMGYVTGCKFAEDNDQGKVYTNTNRYDDNCMEDRAMHYSAKRSIAITSSVCLSVTLVDCDHIGGKSWKLIAWTISPTPSLFVAKRPSTYSQGNMGKFWGD